MGIYDVENPAESQWRIDKHGKIIRPCFLEPNSITEERPAGIGVKERPIHHNIPENCNDVRIKSKYQWNEKLTTDNGTDSRHCYE